MVKPKVAFVGTGDVFLKYYLPEARLQEGVFAISAICDQAPGRAEEVASFLGVEAYTDYENMLVAAEVDIVVIVTPPDSHYKLALMAIEAGKHVYVEKPFCREIDEADHLIELAKQKGVHLMAAPTLLLDPSVNTIRKLLDDGEIGKVAYANVSSNGVGDADPDYFDRFLRMTNAAGVKVLQDPQDKTDPSWYFQKGGGPLFDVGVYSITRITGLLGPVKKVVALSGIVDDHRVILKGTGREKEIDVTEDDLTMILLDLGDSKFVHINTGWIGGASKGTNPGIVGMLGTICESEDEIHLYKNETEQWESLPVTGERWKIPTGLTHLAKCISENKDPDITIEHARHVIEIMQKVYVSARTGRAEDIKTVF